MGRKEIIRNVGGERKDEARPWLRTKVVQLETRLVNSLQTVQSRQLTEWEKLQRGIPIDPIKWEDQENILLLRRAALDEKQAEYAIQAYEAAKQNPLALFDAKAKSVPVAENVISEDMTPPQAVAYIFGAATISGLFAEGMIYSLGNGTPGLAISLSSTIGAAISAIVTVPGYAIKGIEKLKALKKTNNSLA